MLHQVNLFLLLFGALQGGLLSLWFLRNRRQEPANLYIGLFLLVVGLQLTLKVITKVWLMEHVRTLYLLSYQLPFLIGPLLFLYVRTKHTRQFEKTDFLHLLPFSLTLATIVLLSAMQRYVPPFAMAAIQLFTLGVYSRQAYQQTPDRHWRAFIGMVTITEGIIIITLALMVVYHGRFPDVRLLFIVLTMLIYWISYRVIARSDLFAPPDSPVLSQALPSRILQKNPKYAHSSLKPEEAIRIEYALAQTVAREKPFLDSELTIDDLAEKLSTNRHHLSQVLNERLGQTYADYINGLRLEEARQRLSNPAHFRYTIAAIALESGFNSVSSFNDVFRKRFGTTPSKFREPFLKKMSA